MKNEAKVGLFVFIGLLFLFALSTQVSKFANMGKEGYDLYSYIDNAAGLDKNTKVKVNGIEGGYLKDMKIEGNKVKLDLFIYKNIKIPKDSMLELTQDSMLSGKYPAIILGNSKEYLKPGEVITKHKKLLGFDAASDSLAKAADEFKAFIQEAREMLDENSRNNLKQTFANLERITEELRVVLKANELNATINNFSSMAKNLSAAGEKFGNMSDEFKKTAYILNKKLPAILAKIDQLAADLKNVGSDAKEKLPKLLDRFSAVGEDLEDILKTNKKSIGNAISSADEFFSKGGETFDTIGEYINSLANIELEVGLRGEYMFDDHYNKSYFTLNYKPNATRTYIFEAASMDDYSRMDEFGHVILPKKHEKSKMLISAEIAKRYDDFQVRAGIIENTGGLGADYYMFHDKLKASVEIFDFNAENDVRGSNAHLKTSVRYTMLKHIDTYLGVDNILNNRSRNVFLGFGVHFVDNDLKLLLGSSNVGSFVK
ncbi:MAG: MCE family protein [Epsilonproteobacteria bacterium]|nr:MCE family protein [Campylobacterota bacterium]